MCKTIAAARSFLPTLLLLATLPAQEPATPQPPAPTQRPVPEAIVDVDFQGGPLPELIRQLRQRHKDLNIVLSENAEHVKVPPMTLVQVEVEDALEAAARVASSDRFQVGVRAQRSKTGKPVFTVLVQPMRNLPVTTGLKGPDETDVAVFSLRRLTTAMPGVHGDADIVLPAETVLSALDTGLKLLGGPAPTLRYHADSGILFARGTQAQLQTVSGVLNRLEADLDQRRAARGPAPKDRSQPAGNAPGEGKGR